MIALLSLKTSRGRQRGQLLPIAAVAFLLICGLAGLSIDASRDYLVKRQAQNAADFAVLAAGKQMGQQTSLSGPTSPNSNPVKAAHDFAANNGFNTVYGNACDLYGAASFTTTWFDAGSPPCNATTGFNSKVTVNSPPVAYVGNPVPIGCQGVDQYSCFQVVITAGIPQLFSSILGVPRVYVTVSAIAQVTLPGSAYNAPPPNALILYQPQAGCVPAAQQCFNEGAAVARSQMSCTGGSNNCPTFWAVHNSNLTLNGYDGSFVIPSTDLTTVSSNGDMVIQDRTTICDPYNSAACVKNTVVGNSGFAVAGGSKVYCSKYGAGAANATPCTTAGQASLNELDSQETGFVPPAFWNPTIDNTGLPSCGGIVLNGGPVPGACASATEPYVIQPGIYSYIVINHGTYEFESGLYDITGVAPVNTASGGAYVANGIDHSKEVAADFDLCTGGTATSCPGLTAGVWIGHGGGAFGALVKPPKGACVGGAGSPSTSGGGDPTIVAGSGVTFRLRATSGGFVSTGEVTGITLASPGVGSLAAVGGSPILFDMENNSFIHLDAAGSDTNNLSGIIYQTNAATAGGVELDPSMTTGGGNAAVNGQVLAYSFTNFGGDGVFDFSGGYGSGSVSGITTSGKNEPSIITKVALTAGAAGFSVLTVSYADEWMMDAYDLYIKVNNGSPVFFSAGIWTSAPAPGDPLPPPNNNPGDNFPAYPSGSPGGYTVVSATDYIYSIPSSGGSTIEVKGQWTWGHQDDIAGANSGAYTASAIYNFPTPNGNYVSITIFVTDGDHCGDYALASYTFKNVGLPGGGTQSGGTVSIVK